MLLRKCFFLQYYNAWVSLSGTLLCIAVMFLMSWVMALFTFVVVVTLYLYVSYRKPGMLPNTWMQLIQVFWVFALSIMVTVFCYFEGMYCHHLQDWGGIHTTCHGLFKKLGILPLQSQYILSLALFVSKNMEIFTSNSDIYAKKTRNKCNIFTADKVN